MLLPITTLPEFNQLLQNKQLIIIDFFATWCGPCQAIKPFITELSQQNTNVLFAQVDVDKNSETAAFCGITSMPTFLFYKNGVKVGTVTGANKEAILVMMKKHNSSDAGASSSSGNNPNESPVPGQVNLAQYIDARKLDCLNQNPNHVIKNITSSEEGYLQSDVDEQLIIAFEFIQPVKIHSIQIHCKDDKAAPKNIKTFVNKTTTPSFDELEDAQETESLVIKPNQVIPLKFVRYQHVLHLTLFILDNHGGGDETRIDHLEFYGTPLHAAKMENFGKDKEHE